MSAATVYRFFDSHGSLLYVGCSAATSERIKWHSRKSPWFDLADTVKFHHYDNIADAWSAEDEAIRTESPRYNVIGAPDRSVPRQALSAVRAPGHPELTAARRRRGFTKSELAAHIGVDPSTVSRWESGERSVPETHHAKLAEILGLRVVA